MVMDTSTQPAPVRHRINSKQRQIIISSCLGTFIEWFDWSLFGLFAVYFSTAFFPSDNKTLSMLGAGLTFAIAFLFRPVGGWLLGLLADRRGRRPALILAMVLMTAGSFTIGLTPDFHTIGMAAPVLLVLARMAQGISTGGDSTNVYIYMSEIAPKGWRNRYAAFTYVFSGASFLLASIIGLLGTEFLDQSQMQAYGWRLAFVIGGLVGVYGIFARLRLTESEEFEELQGASEDAAAPARERHPLWSTIRNHPRAVLLVFGFTMMMTLLYYALTVSFASYAVDNRGMNANTVYWVTTIGTVVFIALQYPCGWLADRFGRRPQSIVSAVLFMVGIVPLTSMVSDSFWGLLALFTLCMAVYAPMSAIAPVVYADLFPANIRGTGLGTWYNISVPLFGGTVSLVLTALTAAGAENMFFWYIALACAVGLLSILGMKFLRNDPVGTLA